MTAFCALICVRSEEVASYQKFSTPEELAERIANDLALLLTERFARTPTTPIDARLPPCRCHVAGSLIASRNSPRHEPCCSGRTWA